MRVKLGLQHVQIILALGYWCVCCTAVDTPGKTGTPVIEDIDSDSVTLT